MSERSGSAPAHHNVALVTGAAGGLGSVLVDRLCGDGYRVLATDYDGAQAQSLAARYGDRAIGLALNVTSKDDFARALDAGCKAWGGIGVLVNNAALTKTTPLFEISAEEFDAVTSVALKGTFLGCQVLGAHMRENGYGRIVNMASLAGQNGGSATGAHYAAAKGGIVTLTKVFARELAAHGVTVNAISPGPLDLDSVRALVPADKLAAVVASIPAGTLGDPRYVADAVLLLASPSAASMIGTTLDINGGLFMR